MQTGLELLMKEPKLQVSSPKYGLFNSLTLNYKVITRCYIFHKAKLFLIYYNFWITLFLLIRIPVAFKRRIEARLPEFDTQFYDY